uniref:Uncharacterized protein n=1 Tax=Megaselia scalaris TaxID=36166 RepID=T1GC04_MEGSC
MIKQIGKFLELPTALDDIVLAQQCPECAEGEDVVVTTTSLQMYRSLRNPRGKRMANMISSCYGCSRGRQKENKPLQLC